MGVDTPARAGTPTAYRLRRQATRVGLGLAALLGVAGALTVGGTWWRWRTLGSDAERLASWRPPEATPAAPRQLSPVGEGILLEGFTGDDVATSPAGWALLDVTGREVRVLDPEGRPLRTVGRPGSGPGELQRPRAVALTRDGTVAVLDGLARHIDLFPGGGGSDRIPVPDDGCPLGMGLAVAELPPDGMLVQRQCLSLLFERSFETLALELDGSSMGLAPWQQPQSMGDPFVLPLHLVTDGRVYAGDNRAPCLVALVAESGAAAADPFCLPSPAAVRVSRERRADYAALMGDQARRAGLEFPVPDLMPGLVEVRALGSRLALRFQIDDSTRVWGFHEQGTLAWTSLPEGMRAEPGWHGWLVLADELEGQRVWFVPYDAAVPTG